MWSELHDLVGRLHSVSFCLEEVFVLLGEYFIVLKGHMWEYLTYEHQFLTGGGSFSSCNLTL